MKSRFSLLTIVLLCVAALAVTQNSKTGSVKSSFAGTWEGRMNDLPGIDLTVTDGGKIGGTITFYLQQRTDNGPWHVTDKFTTALLAPRMEGQTMTFEVLHFRSHGSSELGPNVKFRLEMTGANDLLLHKLDDPSTPPMKLTRRPAETAACERCI